MWSWTEGSMCAMDKPGGHQDPVPQGDVPREGWRWLLAGDRAVRRDRDSPSVSLPALVAAPARPSSSPAAPPALPGAGAARQHPWVQHPAGKDSKNPMKQGEKASEG